MRTMTHFFSQSVVSIFTQLLSNFGVSTNRKPKFKTTTNDFTQYFVPCIADTVEDKQLTYKIRHQVYVEEFKFLSSQDPTYEYDEYDEYSIHCGIKLKSKGEYAGTLRMIHSDSETQKLPIENFCKQATINPDFHPSVFPRKTVFEISRLAIPSKYRRKNMNRAVNTNIDSNDSDNIEVEFSDAETRNFPFISVGLYILGAVIAKRQGLEHGYVMMEPRLATRLNRTGLAFKQIGPIVDYYGQRAPYYIQISRLVRHFSPLNKLLFDKINKALVSHQ